MSLAAKAILADMRTVITGLSGEPFPSDPFERLMSHLTFVAGEFERNPPKDNDQLIRLRDQIMRLETVESRARRNIRNGEEA